MPNTTSYLFFGYFVIWVLIAYYIIKLRSKIKELEKRFNIDK